MGRMTWIKPSFLWMMYRSGWGRKPGQERVLAIRIRRDGFEWALRNSLLSHFDPTVHGSEEEYRSLPRPPVRIQWDPERSVTLGRLEHRSIQIGLRAEASHRYVNEWTIAIDEVSDLAHAISDHVERRELDRARALLPLEEPYPLPDDIVRVIGAG